MLVGVKYYVPYTEVYSRRTVRLATIYKVGIKRGSTVWMRTVSIFFAVACLGFSQSVNSDPTPSSDSPAPSAKPSLSTPPAAPKPATNPAGCPPGPAFCDLSLQATPAIEENAGKPPAATNPDAEPKAIQATPPQPTEIPSRPDIPRTAAKAPPEKDDTPLSVLGVNDVIGVTVIEEKNVSGTYVIGLDGRVSLPMIGYFRAAGLTIPGLTDLIAQKLRDDAGILDPEVSVQILRTNSKQYTLVGGVQRPGPAPLQRETRILDALAAAGFTEFANKKKIVLRRGTKEFKFNYKDVVKGRHLEQNIVIQDGDLIYVPD